MTTEFSPDYEELVAFLEFLPEAPSRSAAIGFDGFVDRIAHISTTQAGVAQAPLFPKVGDFGRYLIDSPGQSSSFALRATSRAVGGNMPIMGHALGQLGTRVACVGMVGYPEVAPVFNQMSDNCELLGFADPVHTTALEFEDGKLLFAETEVLDALDWETVRNRIGLDNLRNAFADRGLIGLVNWSEIRNSGEIWRGLFADVVRPASGSPRPRIVVDLADCSRKSTLETIDLLELLRELSAVGPLTLILNEGEARLVHERIGGTSDASLQGIGAGIFSRVGLAQIVVRNAWEANGWDADGAISVPTFYTAAPRVQTGAGDNFNAGFSLGQLFDLSLRSSLALGVAVAGYYVREGRSPEPAELSAFLQSNAGMVGVDAAANS